MGLSFLCKVFGHSMCIGSEGLGGPTYCYRCDHTEPRIKWPRSSPIPKKRGKGLSVGDEVDLDLQSFIDAKNYCNEDIDKDGS